MAGDWNAVASTISTRMVELEVTQQELASRAGVALQTVRELQHNLVPRKRTPRTLQAMSTALDLHPDFLAAVLEGRDPDEVPEGGADVDQLQRQVRDLQKRLTDVEARLENIEGSR